MAFDEGLVSLMAEDLGAQDDVERKKMFGGLVFMLKGHMLCGVHGNGAMYRVGKAGAEAALARPGVRQMVMGGRSMGGMVDVDDSAMADDGTRRALLELSLAHVASLPPK